MLCPRLCNGTVSCKQPKIPCQATPVDTFHFGIRLLSFCPADKTVQFCLNDGSHGIFCTTSNTHTYTMHSDQWLLTWIQNKHHRHAPVLPWTRNIWQNNKKSVQSAYHWILEYKWVNELCRVGAANLPEILYSGVSVCVSANQPDHEWTNERIKKHAN